MTLYMTELDVADWPRALAWYRDVLGLPVALLDEGRQFALLGAESGRLALKGATRIGVRTHVRLVFHVEDLDDVRRRIHKAGIPASEIIEDDAEHYRSFQLVDPVGTPVRIFAWA